MNADIAPTPTQTITKAQAIGVYSAFLDKVRLRHDPPGEKGKPPARPENWDVAVAHVVMGTGEQEAAVIFRYLVSLRMLSKIDMLIAECIARRLHLVIEWQRSTLVGAEEHG